MSEPDTKTAIVVCITCGMPVRVDFTEAGEIEKVFAVCGHVKAPRNEPEPAE